MHIRKRFRVVFFSALSVPVLFAAAGCSESPSEQKVTASSMGTMSASPNPCILTSPTGTCTTKLTWATNGVSVASIYVRAGDKPLAPMTNLLSGSTDVPWITGAGATFELHAGAMVVDPLIARIEVKAELQK